LHLHLFNFLYRVRDLRPRWSTRRRAGFSCATLYITRLAPKEIFSPSNKIHQEVGRAKDLSAPLYSYISAVLVSTRLFTRTLDTATEK